MGMLDKGRDIIPLGPDAVVRLDIIHVFVYVNAHGSNIVRQTILQIAKQPGEMRVTNDAVMNAIAVFQIIAGHLHFMPHLHMAAAKILERPIPMSASCGGVHEGIADILINILVKELVNYIDILGVAVFVFMVRDAQLVSEIIV